MRDAAVAIIREIGVECGGSNVQFAVRPRPAASAAATGAAERGGGGGGR